jgi:hypothetical protein
MMFWLTVPHKVNANPNAVKSIHGIVNKVLDIVSAHEGEERDWDAFKNLFLPTARLSVLNHDETIAEPFESITVDEFIELMSDEYYQKGFIEYELGKKIDEYNGIAQVFQSYYGKDSEGNEGRGINSFQLVYFKNRWWIASLIWTGDDNGVEVPKEYISK